MRLSRSLQKSGQSVISFLVKRSKRTFESSLSLSRISRIFWLVFSISFLSLRVRAACHFLQSADESLFFSRIIVSRTAASSLQSCSLVWRYPMWRSALLCVQVWFPKLVYSYKIESIVRCVTVLRPYYLLIIVNFKIKLSIDSWQIVTGLFIEIKEINQKLLNGCPTGIR